MYLVLNHSLVQWKGEQFKFKLRIDLELAILCVVPWKSSKSEMQQQKRNLAVNFNSDSIYNSFPVWQKESSLANCTKNAIGISESLKFLFCKTISTHKHSKKQRREAIKLI